MNLDLVNGLVSNLKENIFMHNFIKELSNYLEKNKVNNQEALESDNRWNNLLSDDLELYNKKIIKKFRDKMLIERTNILQNYAEKTKDSGEMYYIYDMSQNEKNSYKLCICDLNKSHEVIIKKTEELPENANLGSVLRKQGEEFILDKEGTQIVQEQINNMIQEKIKEQDEYLDSKRIDGHIYEVSAKDSGRIWLYDISNRPNGSIEEIEEIKFRENLYETTKKGDLFIYKNGEYQKYIS